MLNQPGYLYFYWNVLSREPCSGKRIPFCVCFFFYHMLKITDHLTDKYFLGHSPSFLTHPQENKSCQCLWMMSQFYKERLRFRQAHSKDFCINYSWHLLQRCSKEPSNVYETVDQIQSNVKENVHTLELTKVSRNPPPGLISLAVLKGQLPSYTILLGKVVCRKLLFTLLVVIIMAVTILLIK